MRRLVIFVVLLTGLCGGELRAQSTNASITGYITDPTKAVIVGAKEIAINVDTNVRYEATKNIVAGKAPLICLRGPIGSRWKSRVSRRS